MKPTVPEVLPQLHAYRDNGTAGNAVGGSLHLVLDDGNIEDSHVKFCIQWAKDHGDPEGVRLGELLLQMSKRQRKKLSDQFYS